MKRFLLFLAVLLWAADVQAQCGPGGCPTGNFGVQQPIWQQPQAEMFQRRPQQEPQVQPQSTPAASHIPAVVWIDIPQPQRHCGSGALVEPDLVLTAWHLWMGKPVGPNHVWIQGKKHSGELVASDEYYDLAVLKISPPSAVNPLRIAAQYPTTGDKLTAVGYGWVGQQYAQLPCQFVRYVGFQRGDPRREAIEINKDVRQGDSGGPILNAGGEIVAVISRGGDGSAYGSYCGAINPFVARAENRLRPLPPAPSVDLASDVKDPRRRLIGGNRAEKAQETAPLPDPGGYDPIPTPILPSPLDDDAAVQAGLDRVRAEAERQAAGLKAELGTLAERIEQASPDVAAKLENIATLRQDFDDLKGSIEALKTIAASDPKTLEELQVMLGSIRDVSDNVGKLAGTVADLQSLPDRVRDTASTVEATQESVAELRGGVDEAVAESSRVLAIVKGIGWWVGIPLGLDLTLTLVVIVLLLIRRDARRFVAGQDEMEGRKIANRTRNTVDDRVMDAVEGVVKALDTAKERAISDLHAAGAGVTDRLMGLVHGREAPTPPNKTPE